MTTSYVQVPPNSSGAQIETATIDSGGVTYNRQVVVLGDPTTQANVAAVTSTGTLITGVFITPSANFTRPADTTTYASGDLVANSVTAGSVVPMSWTAARVDAGNFAITRAQLFKTTNTITVSNFRLHLHTASPTCTNGDNGAWLTTASGYIGAMDINCLEAFSDPGAMGQGMPNYGNYISVALAAGQTIYGLLEARAAYVPGNAEVFTVTLEIAQN